jgi:hypothetical protein
MCPILNLAPGDDDENRIAYQAIQRRDERWPVSPLGSALWDFGLITLGVICTIISITVQYA